MNRLYCVWVIVMLDSQKKYYEGSELKALGLSYYKINQLVEENKLAKIKKSTYENLGYTGEENDFYVADAYVPGGVVCLLSAARYYGLTTFLPDAVDIAVPRSKRVYTLPEQPSLQLHFFDSKRMETGVQVVKEGENSFRIFDMEKTVADILYYRERCVGVDLAAEVLRNYFYRPDRNLNRLYSYAKDLKCEKILRTYLEVLIT